MRAPGILPKRYQDRQAPTQGTDVCEPADGRRWRFVRFRAQLGPLRLRLRGMDRGHEDADGEGSLPRTVHGIMRVGLHR